MSIKAEVRDSTAIAAACRRLGLAAPVTGEHNLFAGKVKGIGVQLKDWQYPVVFDLSTGQASMDTFGGRWGDQKHLDAFFQAYAVEKAKIESRRQGHSVTEQTLADGSIKLTIQVSGGAA